jgi:hypothetical protein
MPQANSTFGIDIRANDRTTPGARSAERRLGAIPRHVSAVNRRYAEETDRTTARTSRSIVRTFARVEQASARAFGGRSLTNGVAGRLGAIREAAAAAGTGMGEAATAGSALEGAMAAVGVAGGAAVGIMAAAAYGAYKLADGWAKGAASIGRTAEIIGVASKQLQEFNAAAERQGVDKGTATGALGGVSQTLNDARYGRNNEAVALLSRLGLKLQLNKDGTVDIGAMLPAIADALQRQNSSGRRTAARILGISQAALPAFTQGGARLSADMKDADKTAYIATPGEIETAKRIQGKQAIVGQMKDRALGTAGAATATAGEGALDAAVATGRGVIDGTASFGGVVRNTFAPAAETVKRAAEGIGRAVDRFAGAINYAGGGGGRLTREGAISEARKGVRLRDKLMMSGFNATDANALAANAVRESGANYRSRQPGGGGRGLWQWDGARKAIFKRQMGVPVEKSSEDQQIAFLKWELGNTERRGWAKAHQYGRDASNTAYGFTRHVERPKEGERDGQERAAVARALETIPVHVTVDMKGAPSGTKTTVRAGRGRTPALSHALAD